MKKIIIYITSIIAFLIVIGEIEEVTYGIVTLKFVSLLYLWLVAKANNYYNQEG